MTRVQAVPIPAFTRPRHCFDDVPEELMMRIRQRVPQIDKTAKQIVAWKEQELQELFGVEMLIGSELKFTSPVACCGSQKQYEHEICERFHESIYLAGLYPVHHDTTRTCQVATKPEPPSQAINTLFQLKDYLIHRALLEGDLTQTSFINPFGENKYHPHMHLNFSLSINGNNVFVNGRNDHLVTDLTENMLEDLQGAFVVFILGQDSLKRYPFNNPNSPRTFTYNSSLADKDDGHSILLRYHYVKEKARAELRVAESSGIDSLQILFIVGSTLNTLDELIKCYEHDVDKTRLLDSLEECLRTRPVNLRGQPLIRPTIELYKTREEAFKKFVELEAKMKQIFGNEIYEMITKD